jgi:serine/threonine protein kinase
MDPQQGPQPDLLIGQTIGNYLVTQKLGEGGMGSVYLAEHPSIGKKVALKVLHSEFSTNQEVAARFFHEAKAVNDIGHPNIVDIVDFGIIQAGSGREQLVYFIMEYLAGVTLSQLIRSESPLPPERALNIGIQVADALSASHKCGIVHRDLKPDNIILLQRGRERDFVKLLDFGIAKLTGGSAMGSHRTRTGIVMGTPSYMSPEQCEGRDSVDLRTDVYALGIVMYEMLTGRVPFLGEGYGEILVQHLTQRPLPLSQFRMLQPHIEAVVLKALEKRADMRYPSMEEFMRAMADPVGYVEANGGVGGFLQRQLMPSSGPLPPSGPLPSTVRLMSSQQISSPHIGSSPHMTPLPGTVLAPRPATPSPTTLGGSTVGATTGHGAPARSKAAYIITGVAIVLAAVAAIIIVVASKSKGSEVANGSGSGSVIDDSARVAVTGPGSAGSAMIPAIGSGSAATPASGSGSAGAGSSTVLATGSNDVGSAGSGSAGSGSTVERPAVPEPQAVKIDVTSSPTGAHILVDGLDTGKVTPDTLLFPKASGKRFSVTLRLRGYDTYTFKSVDAGESSTQEVELVKTKAVVVPTPLCKGPQPARCRRDSAGCCVPDTTGRNPGSGTRPPPPPTQGSSDPDGLMHP